MREGMRVDEIKTNPPFFLKIIKLVSQVWNVISVRRTGSWGSKPDWTEDFNYNYFNSRFLTLPRTSQYSNSRIPSLFRLSSVFRPGLPGAEPTRVCMGGLENTLDGTGRAFSLA